MLVQEKKKCLRQSLAATPRCMVSWPKHLPGINLVFVVVPWGQTGRGRGGRSGSIAFFFFFLFFFFFCFAGGGGGMGSPREV